MRKLLLAALAATVLTPVAASAQGASDGRHDRHAVQQNQREVRQGQREVRQGQREVRRDLRRGDYREAREDQRELREDRRELREDRRDLRENRRDRQESWQDYRQSHRNVYRRPAYVGPRGHVYRPVVTGYRFAPSYYSSRYWINDYSTYRLPNPGRGLRWIRYGNDVILVNMRTGRVVQVHRSFFW